jgi:hypothetical protein
MTKRINIAEKACLAALLSVLGLSLPTLVLAQQPTQAQISAIRSACPSDYRAHCASVPTGGRAALECLQKNVAKLSPACQGAVNAAGGTPSAAPAAAAPAPAAAQPATPGAPPAVGVAPAPAPAVAPTARPRAARAYPPMSPLQEAAILRQACGRDYREFCGDVPPGGGRIIACLRENGPSLSPRCRYALVGRFRR